MSIFNKLFVKENEDITGELSFYKSQYYSKSQIAPYNPDGLVTKKGSLGIYQTMLNDEQVKAVLTMKKHAVLASGWKIIGEDEKQNEFVQKCFENISMEDKLFEILSALEYGFSVSEMIYDKGEDGIVLKDIKTRPPQSFEFRTDEHGNLKKDGLIQYGSGNEIPLPVEKFIIYSYNSEFGNFYGRSDLRAVYRAWFSKDITIKFRNMYNERFGMPLVLANYEKSLSKSQQDDLEKIIKNIQAMTAIKVPKGVEISFLEALRRGTTDYPQAIKDYDTAITRGILCPNLLGFTDINAGSYALGEKQFDVFIWILEKLRRDLESGVLYKQVIKRLIDLNFANTKVYPRFKFNQIGRAHV